MARKIPEINAGSMADIAFLLLIFFLVTTTMDVDTGLTRQLPPPVKDKNNKDIIKERNVFIVLINSANQLAIEGDLAEVSELRERVKEFILNPNDDPDLSEGIMVSERLAKAEKAQKAKEIEIYKKILKDIGDVRISKGVVSLQSDRSTKYSKYIEVQNEIVAAFNELRDELSMQTYGVKYNDLDKDRQKVIKKVYPLSISEAEPRNIGGGKK